MSWYCDYAIGDPLHGPYHDAEYGFPLDDESLLFERLVLEINQAGLSWALMLKKRDGFREAFDNYDVARISRYRDAKRNKLLANADIIRNRLKIDAVIHNAGVVKSFRASHGGFAEWIRAHHPLRKSDWVKQFRRTFRFTGGEITGEFLMSIGYLPGTHRPDCPAFEQIRKARPPWMAVGEAFYRE